MIKKNKKIKTTLDGLAVLMKTGFSHVEELIKKEIDQLAISSAKGFESVDKRFESVDKRFDEVGKRFDIVDTKIEGVNKRIDDMSENRVKYTEFNVLKKRVSTLEKV